MADRKRKLRFSDRELEVLTEEVQKHASQINGKNVTVTAKNHIWDLISQSVSAVGISKRVSMDCKRRWNDLKRRTKEKISFNASQAKQTGGGPSQQQPLNCYEETVEQTLVSEQVTGLEEGIDTGECLQDCEGIFLIRFVIMLQ